MDKSQEASLPQSPNVEGQPPPYPGNYSGAPHLQGYQVPPLADPLQGKLSKIDFIPMY